MAVRTFSNEKGLVRDRESEAAVPEVLTGAAAAAFSAAGIGSFILGLMVVLAEAVPGFADSINFVKPAGPLSGKTTIAVAGWLISWIVMDAIFKGKNPAIGKVFAVSLFLVLLGLALTFPPIFLLFEHE